MFSWLQRWLRNSAHVHIRQRGPQTIAELVELIDRFLDGPEMRYPLEWDDFISWENSNPNIELIRERIEATELLFFSKDTENRRRGIEILLEERNRAAALVGIAPRQAPINSQD